MRLNPAMQAHTPPRGSELFARAQHWKTRTHEYKAHSRGPLDSRMGDHILQMSWIELYALHTSTGAVVIKFAGMYILFSTPYRKPCLMILSSIKKIQVSSCIDPEEYGEHLWLK